MTASQVTKYGMRFPEGIDDLTVELWCYAHDKRPEGTGGRLTKWEHFRNIVDMLWNFPGSTRKVIWNRWTNEMLYEMVYERYVGLAGCASSGKSDAAAVFSLVEWIAAPTETLVLITSTTLKGARKRVWKSVTELWNALESRWKQEGKQLFGKMVQSQGMIVGMDANGMFNEALGLTLVAADQSSDSEAAKKLKGLKAPAEGRGRLRLIADELSDLGYSVLAAGVGNLNTNPDFKMIGMSNPALKQDPFGKFCEPLDGWNSVSPLDKRWRTRLGVCVRFDASQSPRIVEPDGDKLYPWMPSKQSIDQMRVEFGENSREFWSQARGMWCPEGLGNMVWSESELIRHALGDKARVLEWDETPVPVGAIDAAFTTGGDRALGIWGLAGKVKGKKILQICGYRTLSEGITEEAMSDSDEVMTMSLSVIRDFKTLCASHGIQPRLCGSDNTGGGVVFNQWMASEWSPNVRKINFGGAPVERPSMFGRDESDYKDRVSQLWCQPKQLVREGQIVDIPMEVILELCQRKMHDKMMGGKLTVEPKKEMKKRTGRSPDLADAFVILVETCVVNGLLDFEEIKKLAKKEVAKFKAGTGRLPGQAKFRFASPSPKPLIYR